jgi:hypothetical protein
MLSAASAGSSGGSSVSLAAAAAPAGGISALAARNLIWRGDSLAPASAPTWPTGFPALDAELPGGGWPASGLVELLLPQPGCGELRLLAMALSRQPQRELLWIAPPFIPYAPALHALGLGLERLTWLSPAAEADAAWAAEQALRSGRCGAVLWWGNTAPPMLRRLHLAAQEGGSPLIALRPWGVQQQSSPAPLRLACEPLAGDQLAVQVFKRRGPPMATALRLTLPPVATLRRSAAPPLSKAQEVPDVVARAAPALVAA